MKIPTDKSGYWSVASWGPLTSAWSRNSQFVTRNKLLIESAWMAVAVAFWNRTLSATKLAVGPATNRIRSLRLPTPWFDLLPSMVIEETMRDSLVVMRL